jgi:hypothetical protein
MVGRPTMFILAVLSACEGATPERVLQTIRKETTLPRVREWQARHSDQIRRIVEQCRPGPAPKDWQLHMGMPGPDGPVVSGGPTASWSKPDGGVSIRIVKEPEVDRCVEAGVLKLPPMPNPYPPDSFCLIVVRWPGSTEHEGCVF